MPGLLVIIYFFLGHRLFWLLTACKSLEAETLLKLPKALTSQSEASERILDIVTLVTLVQIQ